jgi:hypothetical protein
MENLQVWHSIMVTFAMAHFIIDLPYTYVHREPQPL